MIAYLQYLEVMNFFPLHIHWEGSLPIDFLFSRSLQRGKDLMLPCTDYYGNKIIYRSRERKQISDPASLKAFMQSPRKYSIDDILKVPLDVMQSRENLILAAEALSKDLKRQNCVYAEVRFSPQYHIREGLSIEEAIESAAEGFYEANTKGGADVKLILTMGRELSRDEGKSLMRKFVSMHRSYPSMILGVDLGNESSGHPAIKHYDAISLTFDTPLKRTIHVGECIDEDQSINAIREVLTYLRPDGISHAVSLYKDPDLVDHIIKNNIRVEFNPLSNQITLEKDIHNDLRIDKLITGAKMHDKNILATINPDNPKLIENATMYHNMFAFDQMYGRTFIEEVTKNSIIASWGLTPEEKRSYLSEIYQLRRELPPI